MRPCEKDPPEDCRCGGLGKGVLMSELLGDVDGPKRPAAWEGNIWGFRDEEPSPGLIRLGDWPLPRSDD